MSLCVRKDVKEVETSCSIDAYSQYLHSIFSLKDKSAKKTKIFWCKLLYIISVCLSQFHTFVQWNLLQLFSYSLALLEKTWYCCLTGINILFMSELIYHFILMSPFFVKKKLRQCLLVSFCKLWQTTKSSTSWFDNTAVLQKILVNIVYSLLASTTLLYNDIWLPFKQ